MQCRHRSKGQSCSSSLDVKYLLYVPVFTDLNSLIVRNAYISLLRNPLQINESFRLIPSYGCRDSQLPGQRGERDLLFKAALTTALSTLRGPNPSNLWHDLRVQTSHSPIKMLFWQAMTWPLYHDITILGTKEQVSIKTFSILDKSWICLQNISCQRGSCTWKEHFTNLKRNFFSV